MTHEQELVVRRFRRAVIAAEKAGLVVVADAGDVAIRLLPRGTLTADIRGKGEAVDVHDACGGASAKVTGDACSYTYT